MTIGSDSFSNVPPFSQAVMAVGTEVRIDAKISSDMPLPTPRWVMSSPIHISSVVPAVSVSTIRMKTRAVRSGSGVRSAERRAVVEQEHVARRLQRREDDGQVARVLRDPLLAGLALLLQLLERGTTTVISCRMIEAVM